jgi:hypothetical protein
VLKSGQVSIADKCKSKVHLFAHVTCSRSQQKHGQGMLSRTMLYIDACGCCAAGSCP